MSDRPHIGGKRLPLRLTALALCICTVTASHAGPVALGGTFLQDDQVQFIPLTLSGGKLSVISLGYAGGTRANGQLVGAGGFDTMLFLFNSAGALVAQSDDGVNAPVDPLTGLGSDAAFTLTPAAGLYTLALTQYDNFALGNLSDGFSEAGQGNFTPGLSGNCRATKFCDSLGFARTGNWALDIIEIPEPSALALVVAALGIMTALRRGARPAG
jgi:hypothetical protein